MRNRYLEKFDSIIKIKIEGKNINNYIKRLIKNKINIIKLIPVSYKEVHLIVKYSEYKKISKYKSIYKISIINNYGTLRIKNIIKKNTILLVTFFISIMIMIGLSNLIFTIDIIHEDNSVRTLIRDELARNGIRKFTFKKKYNELERIENKILLDNKDRLEWIEIIETGTKYTVRVEERLLTKENKSFKYQDIVAKKDAIITKINASSGEKVKEVNDGNLLVTYISTAEGFLELSEGDYVISKDNLQDEVQVGDTVEIWTNGIIMETYPAQIALAYRIEKVG